MRTLVAKKKFRCNNTSLVKMKLSIKLIIKNIVLKINASRIEGTIYFKLIK